MNPFRSSHRSNCLAAYVEYFPFGSDCRDEEYFGIYNRGFGFGAAADDNPLNLSAYVLYRLARKGCERYPAGRWSATRAWTALPTYGSGRPGDLRRSRNRPGFLNYRGEPAQSSAVTLAEGQRQPQLY